MKFMEMVKNFLNSIVFIWPAACVFIITNFIIILMVALISGNSIVQVTKWFQFIALIILLIFLFKKINKYIALAFITCLYFLYLILLMYYIFTYTKLDFSFFIRNAGDTYFIIKNFTIYIIILLLVAIFNSLFVYKFEYLAEKKFKKVILLTSAILVLTTFFVNQGHFNNELIVFAKTIYKKDAVIDYYQRFRNSWQHQEIADNENIKKQIVDSGKNIRPKYLDNIIILQLESLNGLLVNETNTPNFVNIARQGIFFPKFYSNSVETILAQETTFCSLPNSFDFNLWQKPNSPRILCLPEIMNQLGYKTFFYKSYDLNFANTGKFMSYLQFKQIHADDIMQPDDPSLLWGYREDVFYQRVFENLHANVDRYNFIYIEIGPTNHWPFKTPAGLENEVPFSRPHNHQERLANTTYLQDKYLAAAWQEINKLFPEKNYTLLILSDHSWPAEFHPQNTFNAQGAFEENFLTAMVMIIGDRYKNIVINSQYSQMDILPSIVDLFGLKLPAKNIRRSFLPEIQGSTTTSATVIQIQPFNNKYINLIISGSKYQYDSDNHKFVLCDLAIDPREKNCQVISESQKDNLALIEKLLPIVTSK